MEIPWDCCLEQQVHPKEGDPMEGIVPELRWSAKERMIRQMRRCSDAKQKVRYLIIVNLLNGRTVVETGKKPAFAENPATDRATPSGRSGRLRRRSGHPFEPENRPGLDGDRTTERGFIRLKRTPFRGWHRF